MTRQALIKVLCRADSLQDTANLLRWAIGHHVEIEKIEDGAKVGCVFISTDVERYENDTTILQQLGFDIIGKIRGVVSWEVTPQENELPKEEGDEPLKAALITMLYTLPVPISIMPRMGGMYAWKCGEATGQSGTFLAAVEAALTHLTSSYKLIRSEMMG